MGSNMAPFELIRHPARGDTIAQSGNHLSSGAAWPLPEPLAGVAGPAGQGSSGLVRARQGWSIALLPKRALVIDSRAHEARRTFFTGREALFPPSTLLLHPIPAPFSSTTSTTSTAKSHDSCFPSLLTGVALSTLFYDTLTDLGSSHHLASYDTGWRRVATRWRVPDIETARRGNQGTSRALTTPPRLHLGELSSVRASLSPSCPDLWAP